MKKDYLEHLSVIAGVHNYSISKNNLELLKMRYNLSDSQMNDVYEYCNSHSYKIYDEDILPDVSDEPDKTSSAPSKTEDDSIREELIDTIVHSIMIVAINRARLVCNGELHLCGTYLEKRAQSVKKWVKRIFDDKQLRFIASHLPAENNDDMYFNLYDKNDTETCHDLSERLNALIPSLRVPRYHRPYRDYLD